MEILKNPEKLIGTLEKLRGGARGILLCDYDGTLAPFRDDPLSATPYVWVPELLGEIRRMGVRVALVTGRKAAELLSLVPLSSLEVWGSHGRERVKGDGCYVAWPCDAAASAVLDDVENDLRNLMPDVRLERKVGSLAIHWRGLSEDHRTLLRAIIRQVRQRCDPTGTLEVKPFHLGCELQIPGPNKGDVVRTILSEESPADVAAVYLGDDFTDEDAFAALGERGLSILVNERPRPTYADIRLEGEKEVLEFLQAFCEAVKGGVSYDV